MERCPITLCDMHELSLPVAFSSAPNQPYELEALCTWLEGSPTNPLTGTAANIEELVLLGDAHQQERSERILDARGLTIAFRMELKDLQKDLKQLNARIEQANRTMHNLIAEKTRVELRVCYLDERYADKKMLALCPTSCRIS